MPGIQSTCQFPAGTSSSRGPLFHVLGQLFGLGPICLTGATVIIMPRVNLDAMMLYIQRYRAKTRFGVPTLYRMILEHDRRDDYDLSSLKYCFTGGDVLPMEVLRRWTNHYNVRIHQGYGATETCGGVTMVTDAKARIDGFAKTRSSAAGNTITRCK